MSESLFIRLLSDEDKARALAEAVDAVRDGRAAGPSVHAVDPASFQQVPGSPFAYWVSERIRRLFTELPPFEGDGRTVRQGLATADDFRFVRTWWEVAPAKSLTGTSETTPEEFRQKTYEGKRWVPFAKGGAYSPYYADLHLVVNWERDGEGIKNFVDPQTGRTYSRPQNTDLYFHAGLTWPLRTQRGFNLRTSPAGTIFGHKGPTAFVDNEELPSYLIIGNSSLFGILVSTQMAFGSYEVGVIQRTSVPEIIKISDYKIGELGLQAVCVKRFIHTADETTHVFYLPATLQTAGDTLAECINAWQAQLIEAQQKLAEYQREIDDIAFNLYGIEGEDRRAIEESLGSQQPSSEDEDAESDEDEPDEESPTPDPRPLTPDPRPPTTALLSYALGCVFGRWNARFATGENNPPELPDPFAPLPVCSPGMLTGEDGLPLSQTPPDYPLEIDWDGILVDDPDHRDDLMRRLREVLELIFRDRAEAIEREAAEILGVKSLRDYFSKPGNGGFWTDHIKRYSKSRRKAPIYWLLQSSKRGYGVWLYYHRLDRDILYKALVNYVEPKIRLEESGLEAARSQLTELRGQSATDDGQRTTDKKPKALEKRIDRQETLLAELRDFRDKLRRAADLGLEPDLNDGVILNIAPLWEVVPWSEAKKYWEALIEGEYEWSSISRQLRAKGLVK